MSKPVTARTSKANAQPPQKQKHSLQGGITLSVQTYLGFWKWVNCGSDTLWALSVVAGKTGGAESTKCRTPRSKPLRYTAATAM